MNKKLGLAVAGALLAASASANAGITIPAGDWTVDLGGNVNAFYANTSRTGGLSGSTTNSIGTGLLPAAIGIGAKTRQNDLDIGVQFTFFTGTSSGTNAAGATNSLNIRQAFLTFGDASWGTIKAGRDIGLFGRDVILSDMTLLGVGPVAAVGGNATYGRIGSGYIYADWLGQFQYTTPNWNGFQASVAVTEPVSDNSTSNLGYQGTASYSFAMNDVTGKVWASGISQEHALGSTAANYRTTGFDIGAKAAFSGLEVVGYYYNGRGLSGVAPTAALGANGNIGFLAAGGVKADDDGGLVQATFVVPTIGTKIGASWGTSNTELNGASIENRAWTVGAYHPLTKSLNLVAEYSNQTQEKITSANVKTEGDVNTTTVGAILFF